MVNKEKASYLYMYVASLASWLLSLLAFLAYCCFEHRHRGRDVVRMSNNKQ